MIIILLLLGCAYLFWVHWIVEVIVVYMYEEYGSKQKWGLPLAFLLALLPVAIGLHLLWNHVK